MDIRSQLDKSTVLHTPDSPHLDNLCVQTSVIEVQRFEASFVRHTAVLCAIASIRSPPDVPQRIQSLEQRMKQRRVKRPAHTGVRLRHGDVGRWERREGGFGGTGCYTVQKQQYVCMWFGSR